MFETYNASYPLEYYSVGDVYTFISDSDKAESKLDGISRKPYRFSGTVDYPTDEEIKKYAGVLKKIAKSGAADEKNPASVLCGVIVSKIKGDGKHSINDGKRSVDKLKVMFANVNAECGYIIKYYAVDYISVNDNGVNGGTPVTSVDRDFRYRKVKLIESLNTVVDGPATIDHETGEISGIQNAEPIVSGITANENVTSVSKSSTSGITAAETVSGITAAD